MAREKRPIIYNVGAPEWMVTFGDMMTLLLTFFILLFSVAKLKDAGKVYDMIYALQGMMTGDRPVHGYLLPNYDTIIDDLRNKAEDEKRHFGERGVHPERMMNSEGDGFYSMRVRDQLRIIIEGRVLFDEGSAVLLEEGKGTLENILVPRFKGGPFRIVIRGHTAPGEGPTKDAEDDLGLQRAREVREYFVSREIPADRFELQTVGSRDLPAGEEGGGLDARGIRRRVEIFVSPQAVGTPIESSQART
jgi:chemotaxis protein MotB